MVKFCHFELAFKFLMERHRNQVFSQRLKPSENTVSIFQCLFVSITSYANGAAISMPSLKFISLDVTDSIFDSCTVNGEKGSDLSSGGAIFAILKDHIHIYKSCFCNCHAPEADVIEYFSPKHNISHNYFNLEQ